jgi:hypothetical protein
LEAKQSEKKRKIGPFVSLKQAKGSCLASLLFEAEKFLCETCTL